jgi:hypothetical protein
MILPTSYTQFRYSSGYCCTSCKRSHETVTLVAQPQGSVPTAGGRTTIRQRWLAPSSAVSHLQGCFNGSLAGAGNCESDHWAARVRASLQSTRNTYGVHRNRDFSVKLGGIFFYNVYSNNYTTVRYRGTQSYSKPPIRCGLFRPSSEGDISQRKTQHWLIMS